MSGGGPLGGGCVSCFPARVPVSTGTGRKAWCRAGDPPLFVGAPPVSRTRSYDGILCITAVDLAKRRVCVKKYELEYHAEKCEDKKAVVTVIVG